MKYNTLGNSGLPISEISMGCMSLDSTNPNSIYVIDKAIDYGVNFFDTADLYENGKNEELVGKALRKKRHGLVIATKVGNEIRPDGKSWQWNPTKKYILKAVERSLIRLKTDYIDLYQLHGGTIDDPIDETIEAFEILKNNGKIKAYGVSSIRPNTIREYVKKSNISTVMMQYSILDRRPEESCLNLLKEAGVSVITRGTLAKGLLAGKQPEFYLGHTEETVANTLAGLNEIKSMAGCSSSRIACDYVLNHQAVSSAVVGFRTVSQVEELLENKSSNLQNNYSINKIRSLNSANVYQDHR